MTRKFPQLFNVHYGVTLADDTYVRGSQSILAFAPDKAVANVRSDLQRIYPAARSIFFNKVKRVRK